MDRERNGWKKGARRKKKDKKNKLPEHDWDMETNTQKKTHVK